VSLNLVLAMPNPTETALSLNLAGNGSSAVKIFLLLTALSFASALIVSLTSFTRIIIVLSFVRQGLGTQSLPPNQVMLGLALVLTGFVMAPTATRIYDDALNPYLENQIDQGVAVDKATAPLRDFMLRQTRSQDLQLFYEASGRAMPSRGDVVPMTVAAPAFMISELTTSFRMGLFVYLPLLLIDVLVGALLMALGMMMVPPTLVSLPLKLGVFLLADGWHLLAGSLLRSF
jgi:flagellar biosynthetic protein FliP